jgi:hypothetical protein
MRVIIDVWRECGGVLIGFLLIFCACYALEKSAKWESDKRKEAMERYLRYQARANRLHGQEW